MRLDKIQPRPKLFFMEEFLFGNQINALGEIFSSEVGVSNLFKRLVEVDTFGGIDASNDAILLEAFEDHDAYRQAIKLAKPIIVGRKGSGKSAIFKKITSEVKDDVRSLGFTFSDYPWEHHGKQKQSGVPDEECYRESWKYFLCLMLCKIILRHKDEVRGDKSAQVALADIEKFVIDSYGSPDPSLTRVFTPGQKIQLSGGINIFGAKGEARSIDIETLPTFYSEVNRNVLESVFKCLATEKRFYICFDELDIGFDPTNFDYAQRLIGLIRAAKYTNDQFKQNGLVGGAIVLLRDDIWHTLRFEDKNKLTQDQVSELRWSKEDGPHCIKKLMERRFNEVLGSDFSWEFLFNEQRQMAGFQSKYGFVCERGFLRPRDVIQYCNEVLKVFKRDPTSTGFDNEPVREAEESYSRYFMQELEDELHKHSSSYEKYFEVLKGLSNVNFSREEFDSVWRQRQGLFDSCESPEHALGALFEFSVIGYLATGGKGAGSKYAWRYLEPRVRFNPDAKSYKVHLGLKNEFDLKLYARRKKSDPSFSRAS